MSTLLEQASLVLIPSGYKEDVVYSQIPTNGNGDLSFTRASNGTRVNSAGLVEVCPWNLLDQSEDFASGSWATANATIVANDAVAPNGTTTADKFTTTSTSAECQVRTASFSILSNVGIPYTTSVYAKKGTANFLRIRNLFSSITVVERNGWFNLNTGTLGTIDAGQTGTITDVGNGWYRCTLTGLVGSSGNANLVDIGFTNTDNTLFPTTSVNGYIWGAQMNIGSTAKPYFPTTDRLNVPRLTYQNGGGGCPSLLLEKQSTNALTYSEDFTQSDWPKQNTIVTANATTSPDGTQNADKLIANTTNARHLIFQAITTSNTHTFTTYAKAGENSFLIMRLDTDSPEIKTWFNLSNGTIGTSQGGSPTITSVGNGWYRCSTQYTPSTSSNIYAVLYTAKTDGVEGFAGNDSDGTYIWGAQLEASSYPTSYIPTTTASATRVADECFKTGISSLIGQTEGVMFIDFIWRATGQAYQSASINSGTYVNSISFSYDKTSGLRLEIYYGGTPISLGTATLIDGVRYKIAFAYKSGNSAVYINGTQFSTNTSAFSFASTLSAINLTYAAETFGDKINEVLLSKTRLSNSELQSLTTL
jgi:hypothetical protein